MIALYLSQYDTIPNIRGLTVARIRGSTPSEFNDININYTKVDQGTRRIILRGLEKEIFPRFKREIEPFSIDKRRESENCTQEVGRKNTIFVWTM